MNRRDFLKMSAAAATAFVMNRGRPQSFSARQGQSNRPNILIFVLDTLTTQNMSLYGYTRETTPNMARFAEKATVYQNHYAAANFTSPGTASMLTGVYPWHHRAFHLSSQVMPEWEMKNLFQLFRETPYHALAYTQNPWVDILLKQFSQGLDRYIPVESFALDPSLLTRPIFSGDDYIASTGEQYALWQFRASTSLFAAPIVQGRQFATLEGLEEKYRTSFPEGLPILGQRTPFIFEDAVDGVMRALDDAPRPLLGYFHFWPPHSPYKPRHEFIDVFSPEAIGPVKEDSIFGNLPETRLQRNRLEYDEYIAYADNEMGRLLDYLERGGWLENSYIFLTSDHGESFERGIWGHTTPVLYDPLIHVPLLLHQPGQSERADIVARTSCVDLLPTLLQLAGQRIPDWCVGRPLPSTEPESNDRSILALEAKSNPRVGKLSRATMTLLQDDHKLIYYTGYAGLPDTYEMYNLREDPEEMTDLYQRRPETASDLRATLQRTLQAANAPYTDGG